MTPVTTLAVLPQYGHFSKVGNQVSCPQGRRGILFRSGAMGASLFF